MVHLERTPSHEGERPARMRLAALVRKESSPAGMSYATGQMSMRRRILVIDHDDEARDIVCEHLLRLGFSAASEESGFSGLVRIAQEKARAPFDGLVLELDMPLLGGMAILQEMRERHPEIPVIVTALSGEIKRLRQAVNLGAKEYLVKPFDAQLFTRKCQRIFQDIVGST
ncbi:MAG: response regulator [Nitrospirota bacterium]